MIIGEQVSLLAELFHERFDLKLLKVIDLLLVAIVIAGQNHKQQLPRLQNEVHGVPIQAIHGARKTLPYCPISCMSIADVVRDSVAPQPKKRTPVT